MDHFFTIMTVDRLLVIHNSNMRKHRVLACFEVDLGVINRDDTTARELQ